MINFVLDGITKKKRGDGLLSVDVEEQINHVPSRECDWEARVAGLCPTYHTCRGGHQIVRCSEAVLCRCGVHMNSFYLVHFKEIKKPAEE